MRITKSATIAWATAVSVAAVIGLGGPAWAASTTKRPPTQPTTQQPVEAGQPKAGARDLDSQAAGAVKGDRKPPAARKAPN